MTGINSKRKKIVLVAPRNPELRHLGDYVTGHATAHVPLGLYNLQAMIEKSPLSKEFSVIVAGKKVTDNFGDYALAKWVLAHEPDMLGLGVYAWNQFRTNLLAQRVKAQKPSTSIIGGGPCFLSGSEDFLKQNFDYDYVISGEGEETILAFLSKSCDEHRDFSNVLGLTWREGKEVRVNAPRPLLDLKAIPSPYIERLCDPAEWGTYDGETQRGCPSRCRYCAYSGAALVQTGPRVRYHEIERIVEEFRIARERSVTKAYFVDPDFASNTRRTKDLCYALADLNADRRISIHIELRAERVNEGLAEALWAAGVSSVEVGLQSIDPHIADIAGRSNNLKRFAAGVRAMLARNIQTHVGVIAALPGDKGRSAVKTVQFVEKLGAKADVFLLSVLEGTNFHREARKLGLEFTNEAPHYVRNNGTIGEKAISRSLAGCIRTLASYEGRRAVGM